jgi:hypothetical protein
LCCIAGRSEQIPGPVARAAEDPAVRALPPSGEDGASTENRRGSQETKPHPTPDPSQ